MNVVRVSKVDAKELRYFWDRFFVSREYRDTLKARIIAGEAQGMELYLHQMVYGKPKEVLQLQDQRDGVFILQIGDETAIAHVNRDGEQRQLEGPPSRVLPEAIEITVDEPPEEAP